MESEPWEALDVDDSDLSAFLRPCKSSSSTVIPGPAGAVQAVMRNRRRDEPLPTQEFLRRIDSESDRDFSTNPWLCALQYVRSQGLVGGDDVAHGTPLSSINNTERVPLVVVLVKSCTPNGFGDMTITVKDPTGTVGASVHRKVLAHAEFGKDVTVGSVLVLQKVAVFSPNRSTSFLNITLNNVVKVCMYVWHRIISLLHFSSTFSMPQGRTEGIMSINCGGELETEMEDQPNPPKLDEGDSLAWIAQSNRSTNSVHTSQGEKTGMENQLERQKHMANPRSSIPSWTEEQLDELLAFD
uniref:Uncharacterized protein C17orf53 isogeny n=1 Tax=Cajanus cajan TaxID=3821 RepID=A0A151TK79_CAJCA|nr:Uncharacterized protein C17orf53 isogeny [Cajanus cajan]